MSDDGGIFWGGKRYGCWVLNTFSHFRFRTKKPLEKPDPVIHLLSRWTPPRLAGVKWQLMWSMITGKTVQPKYVDCQTNAMIGINFDSIVVGFIFYTDACWCIWFFTNFNYLNFIWLIYVLGLFEERFTLKKLETEFTMLLLHPKRRVNIGYMFTCMVWKWRVAHFLWGKFLCDDSNNNSELLI